LSQTLGEPEERPLSAFYRCLPSTSEKMWIESEL
jgi:hypothetical protein